MLGQKCKVIAKSILFARVISQSILCMQGVPRFYWIGERMWHLCHLRAHRIRSPSVAGVISIIGGLSRLSRASNACPQVLEAVRHLDVPTVFLARIFTQTS